MYRNNFKEINCLNNGREVLVYVYEYGDTIYYLEDGGEQINLTHNEINEGGDINDLNDYDVITSPERIESLEDFKNFLAT